MTTNVTNTHPDYASALAEWVRCRDFIAGSETIKKKGTDYLPKLTGQDETEYKSYKDRALFYNAMGRTVQGLMGAIFRKPTIIEPPYEYIEHKAMEATREVLGVGRVGILVDLPKDGGDSYAVIYKAEQIRNWSYITQGDQKVTQSVVLEECYREYNSEEFKHTQKKRYRVLDLEYPVETKSEEGDESTVQTSVPRYRQRVYKEAERTATVAPTVKAIGYELESTAYPTMMGEYLDFIPFEFINSINCDPDVQKPPMIDLLEVNLSHFRTSADLEHGRHFTALPTAWVAGFPKDMELKIGSGTAWVTEEVNAKAGFLEFTGQGLGALVTGLEQKERLMAILGARLFESSKAGVEAAESIRLRQSADTATASHIARIVSMAMQRVYQWMLGFSLSTQGNEAFVDINTDLLDEQMDPAMLTALLTAWQSGAISLQTLLWNIKNGELLPPDRQIDEEIAMTEEDALRIRKFSASLEEQTPTPPSGYDFRYDDKGNIIGMSPSTTTGA